MKGGVAKTTLAVNLADFLARRENLRVLLVDLDPQFNATQCLISGPDYVAKRAKGIPTIYDLFNDQPAPIVNVVDGASKSKAKGLDEIVPVKIRDRFDLLLGDLALYRLEMAGGQGREQRLRRYLESAAMKDRYDLAIIDTPPTPSAWMMSALIASDGYIVPVKPEPLSRIGIDLLHGIVERCSENYGLKLSCYGVILTIVEEAHLVYREAVTLLDTNDLWKGKRYGAFLPKRTSVARKQLDQISILDGDATDAKTALARVAREFRERVKI
jgi:chromosome partitioning protein